MLNVSVGKLQLQTPLLLASGYITETPDFFLNARHYGCAGMITRSLKERVPDERKQVPAPRYAVFNQDSMLNCEWGNEKPWISWLDGGVQGVKSTGAPLIVSMSGRDPEGCKNMIPEFDKAGVDAFEINISCSHSGLLHGNLNVDIQHLQRVLRLLRPITNTPIWIKLSYSSYLFEMAAEAEASGADAIVCTNSIGPGLLIDVNSGRHMLGIAGGAGGLTGKAVFPIALWCVAQLAQTVKIPIIGCGGISKANHVLQMLMAGASAVQLYSAPALKGPSIFRKINAGLYKFLVEHTEHLSIGDIVGYTNKKMPTSHRFTTLPPEIVEERCTGCGVCVHACAFDALNMLTLPDKSQIAVINEKCISCNACVGVCPPKFDAIKAFY